MNENNLNIEDIVPGKPYACQFRIVTMLDNSGLPATGNPGTSFPGPGEYEGTGIIKIRDLENQRVAVIDFKTKRQFIVPFNDIKNIGEVEVIEED